MNYHRRLSSCQGRSVVLGKPRGSYGHVKFMLMGSSELFLCLYEVVNFLFLVCPRRNLYFSVLPPSSSHFNTLSFSLLPRRNDAIAFCQSRNFNRCSSNFGFSKHRFVSFRSVSCHRLGKDRGSDSRNPSFSDSVCLRNKNTEFQFFTKQLQFEMSSLSVSVGTSGSHAGCASVSRSLICPGRGFLAADLHKNSFRLSDGIWLKGLKQPNGRSVHKFRVFAKLRKGKSVRKFDPWYKDIDPNLKSGHLSYLSDFKPLKQEPKPVVLEFEKQYIDLEKKINYVRKLANDMGLDFSDKISFLEAKYQEKKEELYMNLTPYQRLSLARHPNRPTFLDHVLNITDRWVELHGDRAGYDDPAIVAGLGSMDGKTYMFIGQQKGRDTKENIKRNFAMPTPHGYRKAKRLMLYADQHGFPIVTFVDTAGAFADVRSEELGQGEAIANNLKTMFGLKVPIISIVIGEGGSGGALAIACANKLFMMENAVFYVASPEASAAILWKSAKFASRAASKMRISAEEHYKYKIADAVIPEPVGGAHADPSLSSQRIKLAILKAMEELESMSTEELLEQRHQKFRAMGAFGFKGKPVSKKKKLKMQPSGKIRRMKQTSSVSSHDIAAHPSSPSPAKMQEGTNMEMDQVVKSVELRRKLEQLWLEGRNGSSKERLKKLTEDIKKDMLVLVENSATKEEAVTLRAIGKGMDHFVESASRIHRMEELAGLAGRMKSGLSKEGIAKLKQEIKEGLFGLGDIVNFEGAAQELLATWNRKMNKESGLRQKREVERKERILGVLKTVASLRPDKAEKMAKINAAIEDENEQPKSPARLHPEKETEKIFQQKRLAKLKERAKDTILAKLRKQASDRVLAKLNEKANETVSAQLKERAKNKVLAVIDSSESKEEVEGGLTSEVSTMPERSTVPQAVGVDGSVVADNGRA